MSSAVILKMASIGATRPVNAKWKTAVTSTDVLITALLNAVRTFECLEESLVIAVQKYLISPL